MNKEEASVYLYLWNEYNEEEISSLKLEGQVYYDVESLPHKIRALLPIRCVNCSAVLLWEDYFLEYEQEGKAMGIKTSFELIIDTVCPRCQADLMARISIMHYAGHISFDGYSCRRCRLLDIQGLDELIIGLDSERLQLARLLEGVFSEREEMQREIKYLNELPRYDPHSPKYVLVTEGKDDVFVWKGLLQNKGIEPERLRIRILHGVREGGFDEAIATYELIKKMQLFCKTKLVVDSDNKKIEVLNKLKKSNILPSNYHILERKEIESYLFDPEAISAITGISKEQVEERMKEIGMSGKRQLDQLFRSFNLISPDEQVKYLIARRLTKMPKEIQEIIEEINVHIFQ